MQITASLRKIRWVGLGVNMPNFIFSLIKFISLSKYVKNFAQKEGLSSNKRSLVQAVFAAHLVVLTAQPVKADTPDNVYWATGEYYPFYVGYWSKDRMKIAKIVCDRILESFNRDWRENPIQYAKANLTDCSLIGSARELEPGAGFGYRRVWSQQTSMSFDFYPWDQAKNANVYGYSRTYDHHDFAGYQYFGEWRAVLSNIFRPPQICAGNPVEISSGIKVQYEQENLGLPNLPFRLTYGGANGVKSASWLNNFQKQIVPVDPNNDTNIQAKSGAYPSKAQACTSGWNDIKTKLANPAFQTATASYTCGLCEVKLGSVRIVKLALIETVMPPDEVGGSTQKAVKVHRENGSEATFIHIDECGKDEWQATNDDPKYRLTTDANGNFQINTPDGAVESYGTAGQPMSIVTGGQKSIFTYDPVNGYLRSVSSASGQRLDFGYDQDQLKTITTNTSATTHLGWSTNGLISSVTHPNNTVRQYHYEDTRFPKALTGITDERGVRYATWKHDAQGRAISSEHAGGAEKTTLVFNADTTTVTNVLGKKTIYLFEDILGVKRVKKVTGEPTASCVGANQLYTYNNEGFIDTQTDWNGNVTKFGYDSFGREISRTQAFNTPEAVTTQTCWHSTLNKPIRIIEATNITVMDYWPNGQVKTQLTKPRPAGTITCDTAL